MGFMAERAANRMGMRQSYRTASRMQRRRSWMENKMGMRQDFDRKEEEPVESAAPIPPLPPSRGTWPSLSAWPSFVTKG